MQPIIKQLLIKQLLYDLATKLSSDWIILDPCFAQEKTAKAIVDVKLREWHSK